MHVKDITKIFIIESPSSEDNKEGRKEGLALSEILRLAQIKNSYKDVDGLPNFKLAITKIAQEVKENIKSYGAITLHFSMHGNENGIGFTNEESLNWSGLYSIMKTFNDTIGYIDLPGCKKIPPVSLSLSVCKGFSATAMKEIGTVAPYQSLVGPTCAVNWADSIMAFTTFYHNTLHKQNGSRVAVEKMNFISDLDNVFRIDLMECLELKE